MTTIYARQSLDRHGDSLAVARQLDLCREYCRKRGWEITAELVDNDRSATTGVERPGFERLLTSRPERIVVWHVDRLVRLTTDLERVIDLGVNVHAVEAGHLDLSNPAGRAVARTVTAWATYEGEQKALRQKASNDQRAAAGKPPAGRRAFGYTADGMQIVEDEARHTRAAVAAILGGASLRSVTRQLNEAGAVTTAGKPWTTTTLRNYIQLPRLAAQRVHRGEVVGEGIWPPIISLDEHAALRSILSDPKRRPKGRPRSYLLSGVARCGKCGSKCDSRVYGRIERRGPIYVCETNPHLGRKIAEIDDYVESVIVARLARPDALQALVRPQDTDAAERLHAERRTLEGRLDDLASAFAAGAITARQLTTGTSAVRERLAEIEADLPALASTSAAERLLSTPDVVAAWERLDVETKREIIALLADVTIHPAGRGARIFDPQTVTVEPRK